ncbi:mitochondrial potassium channel-like [Glossina fuscipes fuscipes]
MTAYKIRLQFPVSRFRLGCVKQWHICHAGLTTEEKSAETPSNIKTRLQQRVQKLFPTLNDNLAYVHVERDGDIEKTHYELFVRRILANIEEVTHMDEVRKAQQNVRQVKKTLLEKANQKRSLMKELDSVRNDLSHIYRDMKTTNNRSHDKYLDLTRQEIELCMKEKNLLESITKVDNEEQHLLNYELTAAINESYEKEKMHAHFIKVLGLLGVILSSILTFLAAFASHIYQQRRFYALREEMESSLVNKLTEPMKTVKEMIENLNGANKEKESWGSYLKRHTRWTYSWAFKSS